MDGLRVYYAKVKPVRQRQILYDSTYTWNLKNKTSYLVILTQYNKKEKDSHISGGSLPAEPQGKP